MIYNKLLKGVTLYNFVPGVQVATSDTEILEFLRKINHNMRWDGNKPTTSPLVDYNEELKQYDLILITYNNRPGDSGYLLFYVPNFLNTDFNFYVLIQEHKLNATDVATAIVKSIENCARYFKVEPPKLKLGIGNELLTVVTEEYAKSQYYPFTSEHKQELISILSMFFLSLPPSLQKLIDREIKASVVFCYVVTRKIDPDEAFPFLAKNGFAFSENEIQAAQSNAYKVIKHLEEMYKKGEAPQNFMVGIVEIITMPGFSLN